MRSVTNAGVTLTTHLGRHAEALDRFAAALDINPAHEAALSSRGYALEQLGRLAEARDSDAAAAAVLPESAEAK